MWMMIEIVQLYLVLVTGCSKNYRRRKWFYLFGWGKLFCLIDWVSSSARDSQKVVVVLDMLIHEGFADYAEYECLQCGSKIRGQSIYDCSSK